MRLLLSYIRDGLNLGLDPGYQFNYLLGSSDLVGDWLNEEIK